MHLRKWIQGLFFAGLLAGCLAATASATCLGMGTVTGDGVRLRSGPGTDAAILRETDQGDTVIVLSEQDGWYQVDYNTEIGYMSAQYMTLSTWVDGYLGCGKVTSGENLNLRAAPSTDYDVLTTIPPQTVLDLAGLADGWYKVTYDQVTGYVSSDYITRVPAPADAAAIPAAGSLGQAMVDEAMKHLGKAYVYGTAGPNSFDCSGFVQYVYKQITGVTISHSSSQQFLSGPGVRVDCPIEECQPGDLLFICKPSMRGKAVTSHVAICLGDNKIIHASSSDTGVIITDMKKNGNYYRDYVGVRRL